MTSKVEPDVAPTQDLDEAGDGFLEGGATGVSATFGGNFDRKLFVADYAWATRMGPRVSLCFSQCDPGGTSRHLLEIRYRFEPFMMFVWSTCHPGTPFSAGLHQWARALQAMDEPRPELAGHFDRETPYTCILGTLLQVAQVGSGVTLSVYHGDELEIAELTKGDGQKGRVPLTGVVRIVTTSFAARRLLEDLKPIADGVTQTYTASQNGLAALQQTEST
jgi:hypothetical protein